jgi:serine/threonine-protein kinase
MADDETIARFLREAQAAARIKSPHVARVVDVGTLENGSPYLIMELLEGRDLGEIVEKDGPLPIERAIALALQTCEALAAAHASGVIHRDIKPSNLFLTQGTAGEPVVKVLDFGISKVTDLGASAGDLTLTQRSMGSPLYMSPEQMRSARKVDARTDIWSLGAVVYELVTGALPFVAETIPELYALVLDKDSRPPPMTTHRAEVPPALDEIVQTCLRKAPEQRYDNVAALAVDLAPFGGPGGESSAARTQRILETAGLVAAGAVRSPSAAPKPTSVSPPRPSQPAKARTPLGEAASTETSFGQTGRQANASRRKAVTFVGAGIALLGVAAIGAFALLRRGVALVPSAATAQSAPAITASLDPTVPSVAPIPSAIEPASSAALASDGAGRAVPAPRASNPSKALPKPAKTASPADKGGVAPDSVLLNRK